jgi:hypothetical protein
MDKIIHYAYMLKLGGEADMKDVSEPGTGQSYHHSLRENPFEPGPGPGDISKQPPDPQPMLTPTGPSGKPPAWNPGFGDSGEKYPELKLRGLPLEEKHYPTEKELNDLLIADRLRASMNKKYNP